MFKAIFILIVCFVSLNASIALANDCNGNSVLLDGSHIQNMDDVHTLFMEQLDLPSYYGKNLDALYDMLMLIDQPTCIKITNAQNLNENLGDEQYNTLRLLLIEADQENSNLSVDI